MSPSQAREPAQPKDHEQNIRRLSLVTFLLSRPGPARERRRRSA